MNNDPFVIVENFDNRINAMIKAGLLNANGIETQIGADDVGGMYPAPFQPKIGISLYVRSRDLKKAKELLEKSS